MSDEVSEPYGPSLLRWRGSAFLPAESCEVGEPRVLAADSWLVSEGRTLALELHRERFSRAVPADLRHEAADFWRAGMAEIPHAGDWFPRVDLKLFGERRELQLRVRAAPVRRRDVKVVLHEGRDPRRAPTIKGPDLESMLRVRTEAQAVGADEAVIVSPEGYLIEGAYSAIAWWRGDILCLPDDDLERVDSVTARSLETLARALGVDIVHEHTTASELDGHEVWMLNALHGIRIVTEWVGGPEVAERPGRLDLWRRRLDALRRPLP